MHSLQKTILDLIHFPHSATSNEANHGETGRYRLSRFEATGRRGTGNAAAGAPGRRFQIGRSRERLIGGAHQQLPVEKAPGLLVCKEQFFDAFPKFRRTRADAVTKGVAILRSALQGSTEQLLDGLFLTGHDSHPEE